MIKPLFSNIIVAITGSDASILAAKYAVVMAKAYQCQLSAVYVVDTATIRKLTLSKIFVQEEGQEYEQSLKAKGERYLSFVEDLAKAKGVNVELKIRQGAIYTEVLAAADEKKADLIILGGWEEGQNPREAFPHSHLEILTNAKCSVLLAREPYIDQMYKQA